VASETLSDLIDNQIRLNGPMSIANYMGLCLTHPNEGYYKGEDPLGAAGDFITAPEISQMFGELIGFVLVNLWQQMKEPKSFTLLELGPGRGTLMQDALRAAGKATGFANATHLQLFETNPRLREEQKSRLDQYHPYWAEELDAVSDDPLLVVANEFFDALPIRQFVKGEKGWHERLVGLKDDKRMFGLSPTPIPESALPEAMHGAELGTVYEVSLASADVMQRLSAIVSRQGGAIIAIDYGYAKTQGGETLQAVKKHTFADPLETPGEADLSAHVNFEALAQVATGAGLTAHKITSQANFLRRLGIVERADALSKVNPSYAQYLEDAVQRLTGADQMGELFKVLIVTSPGLTPAGVLPS
jgi:NADH dehydrogenase [ubiquinone] 1 alpha subcomplex assembly factor 7